MTKSYYNLHNHTEFSNCSCGFPDVLNKVEDLIDEGIELGYDGMAITDHESLQAFVRAEQYLTKKQDDEKYKNFKVIRGNEIYLSRSDMSKDSYKSGDKFYHFILIALDRIGYDQLRVLSNRAWNRSFFKAIQRRWNTIEDLQEVIGSNPGHVVGTSACIGGILGTYFLNGETKPIEDFIRLFCNIFGKDNFYIEMAPATTSEDQIKYNQFLYNNFHNKYNFLISTDAHYLRPEDFKIFKAFLNSKDSKDRETEKFYSTAYLWSWDEIQNNFKEWDQDFIDKCRQNSVSIGERVQPFSLAAPLTIPKVPIEKINYSIRLDLRDYEYIDKFNTSEYPEDRYLIAKIFQNYDSLIDNSKLTDEQVYSRINQELEELWKISEVMNQRLSNYLITMSKMIDVIWEDADTLVGVSRGSAGSWITNYLLGITQMNPLLYPIPIYHWRFIHHSRPDIMDVDFDTPGEDKDEVIQALRNYFESIGGSVTQVAAYKTEASRSALRTAARGLGIDDETALYATSLLAAKRGIFPTLQQVYAGDDEVEQVKEFKRLMDDYPQWKAVAWKIEGLITGLSAHAAGIMVRNDKIEDKYSIMKTTAGITVTSNDLHESEYEGLIKFDALSVDALGKIKNCLYYLLEDGQIEWQGSLKETYKKYLWPSNLKYSDEFWKNIQNNEIFSLFQLNTQVGRQGLANVKPTSIEECGIINTLIRLQPQNRNDPMPIDVYKQYKQNIDLWYQEMRGYNLTEEEIKLLENHLLKLSGVADSQESVMQLAMDPHIANFDMKEANKLRKGIAKKSKTAQEEVKKLFYEKGFAAETSKNLLDYVWNVQIGRQLGYSFSLPHVAGYTYMAMQEAELYTYYPHVYWNAAVLSSDAGSNAEEDFKDLIEKGWKKKPISKRLQEQRMREEFYEIYGDESGDLEEEFQDWLEEEQSKESTKAVTARRGMIAYAISNLQGQIKIENPDINLSRYGFVPDVKNNTIVCGLKIVAKLGDALIDEIIKNRPYTSLQNFLSKVKISKDRVSYLIKSGAFKQIENKPTIELLKEYVLSISEPKKRLTLQNLQMLINYKLLPDELSNEIKLANWIKYIRKTKYDNDNYVLDERSYNYYYNNFDIDNSHMIGDKRIVDRSSIDKVYSSRMDKVRNYIQKNSAELLEKLNYNLFMEWWSKYGVKNEAEGELNSMRIYLHDNPLAHIKTGIHISTLEEVRLAEIDRIMNIKGKQIPKMKIHVIVGTIIDKDKLHNMVTILTPQGAIEAKMAKEEYAFYSQKILDPNAAEKTLIQDSFFEIGTNVIASGCLQGDLFKLKVYKDSPLDKPLMKATILEDGHLMAEEKIGNRE